MEDLQFLCKSNHQHPSLLSVERCNERRAISEVVDHMQWQVAQSYLGFEERKAEIDEGRAQNLMPPPPRSRRLGWFTTVLIAGYFYVVYRIARG